MNQRFLLVALLLGLTMSIGHAFSLDAAGYDGGDLAQDPFSVRVPGYGEVVFESDIGSPLVLNPAYRNGEEPGDALLCCADDEFLKLVAIPQASRDLPVIASGGDDAEVAGSSVWNAIPEPATAGLGLVGMLALLLSHRR